jgi:hypothetical protein
LERIQRIIKKQAMNNNSWQPAKTAPRNGEWILVCKQLDDAPFTVQYITPFSAAPELADWRDSRGKVRWFKYWKAIV